MIERVHEHLINELGSNTRTDIIFVLTKDGMEGPFPRDSIDYEQLMAIEFGKGPSGEEGREGSE